MRLILIVLMLTLSASVFAGDAEFSKKASGEPELIQTGSQKDWCPVCGMNLKMFYKTSHAVKLKGGHNEQYCSMRCMLQNYEGLASIVKQILVVDAAAEKLIPAVSAHYVIGSKAPGTMSAVSKYAFADIEDAKRFQAKMGGEIVTYSYASKSALESMQKDIAMTNMKREKMMYPKGEMIFNTVCDKSVDPFRYNRINELKADIKSNSLCGNLGEKELQAVALYLWDVARKNNRSEKFITVQENEKCPVCGMFVHKYPKWTAKINYKKQGKELHAVFDGVKDMMKFYLEPEKWGYTGIDMSVPLVTDYYSNKAVKADEAFFVIGSDVYGPMGKELIAFDSLKNARSFMSDHSGKDILTFGKITKTLVYGLDE